MGKCDYKIIYNRRNKLKNDGTAAIVIEVYWGRNERKIIDTKISITPEQWDDKRKKVNTKHSNYVNYNVFIKKLVGDIESFELKTINAGKPFTKDVLTKYLNNNNSEHSFNDFYQDELNKDNSIVARTRRGLQYTLNLLNDFKPEISFNEIDFTLVQDFDYYMRNEGLSDHTIYKHHAHVIRFINIAIKKELLEHNKNPYLIFKRKPGSSDRKNITATQLQKMEELKIPEDEHALKESLDMFLFSCYTGIRFGDMQNLTGKHVLQSKEGYSIRFSMEKVVRSIELPLYTLFAGKPQEILLKYYHGQKGTIFPRISDPYMNRNLKVLAISAGIDTRVSFHVARHTFGSLMADITGNPFLIQQLMGHRDIKTSMIYIHSSQENTNKILKGINWESV